MPSNSDKRNIQDLEALVYYSKKFERLRVDRAHGVAPHKPILLLSVIEQIRREIITENKIYLSSELIQTNTPDSFAGEKLGYVDKKLPLGLGCRYQKPAPER